MKKITILCPAFNEEAGIQSFLSVLDSTLEPLSANYLFHVVILNDGSTDKTAMAVSQYDAKNLSITLCNFTRNFGKEAAIYAGLERYSSDAYIVMDTDLQHPPSLIPQMLEYWEQGFKVVESVKSARGKESLLYKLFSTAFYRGLSLLSSLELENHSDYKLLDNEIAEHINKLPEKQRFFRGLVEWLGFPSVQIPFTVPEREGDSSSWSALGLFKYSIHNIVSFTSAPLHLVTLIGFLMLIISSIIGSVSLYQWVIGVAVTGFTTVILLLLFIGSILMISLGLIGLYLAKIYDEIKARPTYLVQNEINYPLKQRSQEESP
ncbi:glycosyltransferase family 2 protein [Marinomonas algicola]|uniref:glycosyltransferase family 2 protein n=1 Tax=Marinomonas algicola TaxID=2773454 RepID=UPI00174E286D|nr:glycosyltransferase family 2 protein [Marinomonas algicola]